MDHTGPVMRSLYLYFFTYYWFIVSLWILSNACDMPEADRIKGNDM